jgi:phospholipase/carboxylesterase
MPDAEIAVSWSREPAAGDDLLVLLHGLEGTERDLDGRFATLPASVVTVGLRAPIEQGDGAAWFLDGDGARGATRRVLDWLDSQSGFATIGVLGLSQGAAMALQLLRIEPQRFAYVVQLSGIVLEQTAAPKLTGLAIPVFSGHGELDEVMPRDAVAATNDWLAAHTRLTQRSYVGMGHWISEQEADDVCEFIADVLGR